MLVLFLISFILTPFLVIFLLLILDKLYYLIHSKEVNGEDYKLKLIIKINLTIHNYKKMLLLRQLRLYNLKIKPNVSSNKSIINRKERRQMKRTMPEMMSLSEELKSAAKGCNTNSSIADDIPIISNAIENLRVEAAKRKERMKEETLCE